MLVSTYPGNGFSIRLWHSREIPGKFQVISGGPNSGWTLLTGYVDQLPIGVFMRNPLKCICGLIVMFEYLQIHTTVVKEWLKNDQTLLSVVGKECQISHAISLDLSQWPVLDITIRTDENSRRFWVVESECFRSVRGCDVGLPYHVCRYAQLVLTSVLFGIPGQVLILPVLYWNQG